ncbi:MAG: tRNA 2-thiouridine(34) synthase MnmA [Bacillota bacterium]
MEKGKIIVGLSGGVDSTVAAYLLKKEGYEVIGATLDLRDSSNQTKTLSDAKLVAEQLGIQHVVLNLKEEFQSIVIDDFISSYENGLTPNPCVVCNPNIKFHALLEKAKEVGAEKIATGHYARIEVYEKTGRLAIFNSATSKKDQTYALYGLTQEQLEALILPIGEYEKDEVRRIAEEVSGYISEKKDSQDICFIPNGGYADFIANEGGATGTVGNFIYKDGTILGQHKGIVHYTVGQRKGLGIAFANSLYVKSLSPETNTVHLCEDADLYSDVVRLKNVSTMAVDKLEDGMRLEGKIRYHHKKAWCTVHLLEDGVVECVFDEPQRAITPGQSVVLYDGVYIVAGGIILN